MSHHTTPLPGQKSPRLSTRPATSSLWFCAYYTTWELSPSSKNENSFHWINITSIVSKAAFNLLMHFTLILIWWVRVSVPASMWLQDNDRVWTSRAWWILQSNTSLLDDLGKSHLAFISRPLLSQSGQTSSGKLICVCLLNISHSGNAERLNVIGNFGDISVNLPFQITHKNQR